MQTAIRSLTRRYTGNLVRTIHHHAPTQSTPASSLAVATSVAEVELPLDHGLRSRASLQSQASTLGRQARRLIPIHRIERLISRGDSAKACRYILARATRDAISADPRKRAVVLKALEAFLKAGHEDEARELQCAFFGDARAHTNREQEGYHGLLLLCLSELTPSARLAEGNHANWRTRAHRRILGRVQPILQHISADELARALDRISHIREAGAQLCLALAGAYAHLRGDDSPSRRLGIQLARIVSNSLAAESEAEFRRSINPVPGVEALLRRDGVKMPWAARALRALQRTSRLEQSLADAHHARHLRALYEERAKGKGPLEPVSFTFNELVRDDAKDADVPELSEIQLDLIAEGARMSLLATALAQREAGARPSPAERRTFRSIGARLAAFSRADFEQMSEAELNDLIARQEQYMKMALFFAAGPSTADAASDAQAPGAGATAQPDTPDRSPEDGTDACTVASPVHAAGSSAELPVTNLEEDGNGLLTDSNTAQVASDESSVVSTESYQSQLRSFAELLDMNPTEQDLDLDALGQRLVDKAIAAREDFEIGAIDQSKLDDMTALIERYKELQAADEAFALHVADAPSTKLSFDEVVHRLHDVSTPSSTDSDALGSSLRSNVSTLEATTTFLAEVARLGGLQPAHISAALATMASRGIEPDARFFTVLITASVRIGDVARAHALYDTMLRSSGCNPRLTPTSMTFASLFKAADFPQAKSDSQLNPRKLFLPTQPNEGIRSSRTLFREMMNLHDRVTRGMRTHRMGAPAPGSPPIAIITRNTMRVALRTFLSTGDLPGALGVLRAFKELHIRPDHTTYNVVFHELIVHIRRDLSRPRSVAGHISSRWSARLLGADVKDLDEIQMMRRLYDIAIPEGPYDLRKVPNTRMTRGAQRVPRGAKWEVTPLERLIERAVYTGMLPQPGLEMLTREVAREECERARREMVPPPYKPEHRMRAKSRVLRAWRATRLREERQRRKAESEEVVQEEEPRTGGEWDY